MDEIIDYKRISDAKRGYLTPRRLDNLKCKVRCAEHAAETLAKLERGENFDDKLRVCLATFMDVRDRVVTLNLHLADLVELADSEAAPLIGDWAELAETLEELADGSEAADAVMAAFRRCGALGYA